MMLPLMALLTVSAAFGLLLGLRAIPPSETEIIDAAAARYLRETGGARSDCHATPGPVAGVRLVVICDAGEQTWTAAFDAWGTEVTLDADLLEQEPRT
jgi:hypothetical protein